MFNKKIVVLPIILSILFLGFIYIQRPSNEVFDRNLDSIINPSPQEQVHLSEYETYHDLYLKEHKNYNVARDFDLSNGVAEEIPVLIYHHMLLEAENNFINNSAVINVEDFYDQMKVLYENGYTTVNLSELEKWVQGKIELPSKSVVITFDDGYLSNYIYAYPILKEFGFNASQFLITNTTGDESQDFDSDIIQYLSWEDIVKSLDVFEYSNHSHDMHQLDGNKGYMVSKPIDYVYADIVKNMSLTKSSYFVYPYGHYNEEVLEALELAGIRMAFTVTEGPVRQGDSLLELNRYGIFPSTSMRKFNSIINNN